MSFARLDSERARAFITAGDAVFTLVSGKTGTRFTYHVAAAVSREVFFVSLLTGPNNTRDFELLGVIFGGTMTFRSAKKSRISEDAKSFVAFDWTWRRLCAGAPLPNELEIWHEGKCGRCGRPLTTPESIALGLGPVCAEKDDHGMR